MTTPLSIRFDTKILDRLRQRAAGSPGATASGLAQRLVDEGLRQAEYPGVVFKDGPSGRRAALALGPDVWEVVVAVRSVDERGQEAVAATAELLALTPSRVRLALRYYSAYEQEIDDSIAAAETASSEDERAWWTEQRLLA